MNGSDETNRPRGSWLKPGLLMLGAGVLLAGGLGVANAEKAGFSLHHMHDGAGLTI